MRNFASSDGIRILAAVLEAEAAEGEGPCFKVNVWVASEVACETVM